MPSKVGLRSFSCDKFGAETCDHDLKLPTLPSDRCRTQTVRTWNFGRPTLGEVTKSCSPSDSKKRGDFFGGQPATLLHFHRKPLLAQSDNAREPGSYFH